MPVVYWRRYTDHCPIDDGETLMMLGLADWYCVNRLKALYFDIHNH